MYNPAISVKDYPAKGRALTGAAQHRPRLLVFTKNNINHTKLSPFRLNIAICFFLAAGAAFAQEGLTLRLLPLDADSAEISELMTLPTRYPDSVALIDGLRKAVDELHARAYLEASVDTLVRKDTTFVAFLHLGPAYRWARLAPGNIEQAFLEKSGFRERLYRNQRFSFAEVRALQEELLTYAENHGYPFARTWLDGIRIEGETVSARLRMDKNYLVLLEELAVSGDVKISQAYLSNYLGLRPGSPYDQSRILRVRDRLRELPFLKARQDPTVTFEGDRATVNLNLERKRASRFDFLIGVLPNSNQLGRMLITGTFNGEFQNQFGLGERIFAEFERLRPETQELNLAFNYPYVLDLPFGADLKFNLYKRDTTYLDLEYDLGIQYLFEGGNYLKAFWNNRSSSLLTVDAVALEQRETLPDQLDVRNTSFGLEYLYQRLDYRLNPRRGWSVMLRGGAGTKVIKRNNRIEELDYGFLYDSLQLRTFQYRLNARLAYFLPLFSSSTIKAEVQGGYLLSESPVYLNEQFRIGGNRLLRGFDEEFIFATNYTVATLEYRLLIGQNSYLYAFGDYAYVEDVTTQKRDLYQPYGYGAGITFETKVGLFGISLAYGARQGTPVDFSAPKVHFGYVSLF